MSKLKIIKRQILVLFIFSILISIAAIIHGIFFDLAFEEIKRLTISGLIFTLIVIFPALLVLEYIFDMNNQEKFNQLELKINKLSKLNKNKK